MADINDATITVSVKQAVLGAGAIMLALLGGAWTVLNFSLGGMQDDVAAIRNTLTDLQARDHQYMTAAHSTETDLRGQIADLTAVLRTTTLELSTLNNSVAGLDKSITGMDEKLTRSIFRQQDFERWVMTRLGAAPSSTTLPDDWFKIQSQVITEISAGSEPLSNWLSAIKSTP